MNPRRGIEKGVGFLEKEEFFKSQEGIRTLQLLRKYGMFNTAKNSELFFQFLEGELQFDALINSLNGMEIDDSITNRTIQPDNWKIRKNNILNNLRKVVHSNIKARKATKGSRVFGEKITKEFKNIENNWLGRISNSNLSSSITQSNFYDKLDPLKCRKLRESSLLRQHPEGELYSNQQARYSSLHQSLFNSITDKYVSVLKPGEAVRPDEKLLNYLRKSSENSKDFAASKLTMNSHNKGNMQDFFYKMHVKQEEHKLNQYFGNKNPVNKYSHKRAKSEGKFFELEKSLMLNDVLNFDPSNSQQMKDLLESRRGDYSLVAICPKDWVATKKKSKYDLKKGTIWNKQFLTDKNDLATLNPKNARISSFFKIPRNRAKKRGFDESTSFDILNPLSGYKESRLGEMYETSRRIQSRLVKGSTDPGKRWTSVTRGVNKLKDVNEGIRRILSRKGLC